MPYHSSTFAGSEIRYWHNVGNQFKIWGKNMWRCETLSHVASDWFIEFLWAGASPLSCFYCPAVNKNFSRWNFDLLGMYPPPNWIYQDPEKIDPKLSGKKQDDSKSMFLMISNIRTEKLREETCMTPCSSCYLKTNSDVLVEMLKIWFLDRNAGQFVIQWKSRIFPGILSGFLFVQICLPRYFPSSFPRHHHHSKMQHICQIFCSLILQTIIFETPFFLMFTNDTC